MGATSSTPSPEEVADAALFADAELKELRDCCALLATHEGVLASDAFADAPQVLPWDRLLGAMAVARGSAASWPGFLALVTRCCKASKRERTSAL
eukprot:5941080-Prymnesium_polylepis.1